MSERPAAPAVDDPSNLRAIADDTYDWESWVSPDGELLWVNPAVVRMTGYSVAECLAMADYPLPLVHADDRERIRRVLESARQGSSGNDLELLISHKDGTRRWVAMSWQSTHNARGEALGYRTSVRDIDDRKRLEMGLAQALYQAEAADRTKSEFLAMMSHELRTPLHCIGGYAELLAQLSLPPAAARFIQVISAQGHAMLQLVDDLLELSALESAEPVVALTPTDLAVAARSAALALEPLARERGLSLELSIPEAGSLVRSDARRVSQVITNLVENGIKFTPEGHVRVKYEERPRDGEHVELSFSVSDTGIGIEPGSIAQAFEPFKQLEPASTRRAGGVGLGLAIAQRIARMLGGELRVESEAGVGSTFSLVFCATLSHEPAVREEAPADGGQRRIDARFAELHPSSILLVDDSAASRELLLEMLRLHGYEPTVAAGGVEALELARTQRFDLAILDYHMPLVDGPTLARALRRAHAATRIVALTADVLAPQRLADDGFDATWVKPLSVSALQRMLIGVSLHEGQAHEDAPSVLDARVLGDLKRTRGREGRPMFERLAPRVLADATALHADLRAASTAGDYARLSQLVHALKGHFLIVGARRAAQVCERLERLAAAELASELTPALAELDVALSEAVGALQAELASSARV